MSVNFSGVSLEVYSYGKTLLCAEDTPQTNKTQMAFRQFIVAYDAKGNIEQYREDKCYRSRRKDTALS